MKESNILSKLKRSGKLQIVEPSENICNSYLEKAENCLLSAKILLQNSLYENSVSEAYYAMYNSLTALLFKSGIKCENHTGAIALLKEAFGKLDLSDIIKKAKKERIDKQYYITDFRLTEENAKEMVITAEDFLVKVKLFIKTISTSEINSAKEKVMRIV